MNMSYANYGSASRSPPMNVVNPRPSSKNLETQAVLSGVPTPSHLGGQNASFTGGNLNNVLFSSRPVDRHHNQNLASYTHMNVYHGTNRPMNVPVALSKAIPRSVRGGGHTPTHGGGHTPTHGGGHTPTHGGMMMPHGGGHKMGHKMGGGHKMGHYGGDLVGGDAASDAQNVSGTIKNVAGTIASFLPFIL